MSLEVVYTDDGSATLFNPELNETYHSRKGARSESLHVFIQEGLQFIRQQQPETKELQILEVGLGTGLNAALTAAETSVQVTYVGLEPFPPKQEILEQVDFQLKLEEKALLEIIQQAPWSQESKIKPTFTLKKINQEILECSFPESYFDLVYYDAFAPFAQLEMWEAPVFEHLTPWIKPGGVLVTYCAQGQFRRNLKSSGWLVEKIPGPPGKREMVRAIKQRR